MDFSLQFPTTDDLRKRAAVAMAAAKIARAEQQRLADRARADAMLGEFVLTGSDSVNDTAAAAGQLDLFGA